MSEYLKNFNYFVNYYKKKKSPSILDTRPQDLSIQQQNILRNYPKLKDAYNQKWGTAYW